LEPIVLVLCALVGDEVLGGEVAAGGAGWFEGRGRGVVG